MKVCSACGHRFNSWEWICPNCSHTPKRIEGYLAFAPSLAESSDGFEAKAFTKLSTLEAKNFWFVSRNCLILWALQNYFPEAKNFLEIGCGTGFVLSGVERTFPQLTLYGSEIFTAGLGFAAQRLSRAELFQMDARKIPFENEFDVIGAFDVLEHIKEDTTVLSEMHRGTLKAGGIMITVPQHPWLWSQADDHAHHVRRYCAEELKIKVEDAGFKVVRMTSFVSLLLPLMLLSRWRQRRPKPDYDGASELRISGWMNGMFENILNLERLMIQLGISFPVGGSLLLIAKKL